MVQISNNAAQQKKILGVNFGQGGSAVQRTEQPQQQQQQQQTTPSDTDQLPQLLARKGSQSSESSGFSATA